jgi:diaminopimelate epimerase
MKFVKTFENFGNQFININDIKLEREIVLVDTSNPHLIIKTSQEGKMPLDMLRVETMAELLKNGKTLPPIVLYKNNLLKDGHHRYAAYKLAGINEVPFEY